MNFMRIRGYGLLLFFVCFLEGAPAVSAVRAPMPAALRRVLRQVTPTSLHADLAFLSAFARDGHHGLNQFDGGIINKGCHFAGSHQLPASL